VTCAVTSARSSRDGCKCTKNVGQGRKTAASSQHAKELAGHITKAQHPGDTLYRTASRIAADLRLRIRAPDRRIGNGRTQSLKVRFYGADRAQILRQFKQGGRVAP
jgi:hypothetical protein